MTGLLVSVRDLEEALVACQAGVDLLDIKEPSRGSLGAATPEIWQTIRAAMAKVIHRLPREPKLSAACGELADPSPTPTSGLSGFQFAKIGLAGCRNRADWTSRWHRWAESLPSEVASVGVAYADDHAAESPLPRDILLRTAELGARMFLIDTFDKTRGDLFAYMDGPSLTELADLARECGVGLVLAGSLRSDTIPQALEFQPEYVAVRGAACTGGRDGRVDAGRIARLRHQLQPTPTLETRYTFSTTRQLTQRGAIE